MLMFSVHVEVLVMDGVVLIASATLVLLFLWNPLQGVPAFGQKSVAVLLFALYVMGLASFRR